MNSGKHWFSLIEKLTHVYGQVVGAAGALDLIGAKTAEAAKLNVLIAKVSRAKAVLEQLEQLQNREAALKHQYDDVLQKVSSLEQQLSESEVGKMAEFTESEGFQPLVAKLKGWESGRDVSRSDPFGILMGLSPNNPHAPMSWSTYLAALKKLHNTTKAVLDAPAMEQLVAFSQQRRLLLAEMHTLQRKLEGEVQLPSLAPLDEHLHNLEQFVARVRHAKYLHSRMLQRDLGQLQLGMLEIRVKIDMGEVFHSSEERALLKSVRPVCERVLEHGYLPSINELTQLRQQLQRLVSLVQMRKGNTTKPAISTMAERVANVRA